MEEIELTFLPKSLPSLAGCESKEILDIYLPSTARHPHLRIRHSGEKYEITNKEPITQGDASHQLETTIKLGSEEFDELAQVPGKRISKTRYFYKENGHTYEIDVFHGNLEGLVVVEIEFSSLQEKSEFRAPEWLLVEITQEEFIAGGMLCGKSYADVADKLASFGYEKVL